MPINPARTTTTSASTGARPGRSGMRSKQPSKVRTVSHKSPRASARHSMSQNVIHQRTSLRYRRRSSHDLDELDDGHDGAQARQALVLAGPVPHGRDEDRPAGAHDHRESHAQGDRPALARDPDGQRQADARDQGAVGEDRRDQEAGTEEQRTRRTIPRSTGPGVPGGIVCGAFTARARASPSNPGPIASSAT